MKRNRNKQPLTQHALDQAYRWRKTNIFQLAKRVRRAIRNGDVFLKVIAQQSNPATMHPDQKYSVNRMDLAYQGLRQCEKILRVAGYYLRGHNIEPNLIDERLAAYQAA
jgi:hypothetical protein